MPQDTAHGYDAETEYFGEPAREHLLQRATQWQADLIVMGATARTRIMRRLMGDTALHAIRHADVPLYLAQ